MHQSIMREDLPLNHVLVDDLGHNGDGHGRGRRGQDIFNLRVLETDVTRKY